MKKGLVVIKVLILTLLVWDYVSTRGTAGYKLARPVARVVSTLL